MDLRALIVTTKKKKIHNTKKKKTKQQKEKEEEKKKNSNSPYYRLSVLTTSITSLESLNLFLFIHISLGYSNVWSASVLQNFWNTYCVPICNNNFFNLWISAVKSYKKTPCKQPCLFVIRISTSYRIRCRKNCKFWRL